MRWPRNGLEGLDVAGLGRYGAVGVYVWNVYLLTVLLNAGCGVFAQDVDIRYLSGLRRDRILVLDAGFQRIVIWASRLLSLS